MSTREVALAGMFGALGNALAILSMALGNLAPQIAIDLSHVGTLAAAALMGPGWGGLVGCAVSVTPFVRYSLLGYLPPLVGALIFPGKAISGVVWGLLLRRGVRPILAVLVGYIPESVLTYFTLEMARSLLLGAEYAYLSEWVVMGIVIKAWGEIAVLGVLAEFLIPALTKLGEGDHLVEQLGGRVGRAQA